MSVEEAMERYGPSELTPEDLLVLEDPHFHGEHVAVVTGSSSGIGRATALAFAANGLTVVGTGRDEATLESVREDAEAFSLPGSVVPVTADLTDDEDIERLVDEAATYGAVRYLANIAGVQHVAPIESFPVERYDLIHAVNQRAPLLLAKACLPHFRANGGGVVANMCSVHGHVVTQDKVGYNTTKFGLRGLTKSIAAEGDGAVRAFTVSTAYVKTALLAEQLPATANRRGLTVEEVVEDVMLEPTRVNELMEPVEVANLFVFGCSNHSDHLNGTDLTYDGGMTVTY
ncbi:SDR family NAD(P)-dependent oxidoreductase [Natronobiforma cellulositropha]|uniref:SDR family NAD(P)-dependent oxidoreductase n=1 Tax=Natronobiforma cellulositropha TaxID=1679076 RepID=UPI0021D604FE|nr:SDR family NAD(P)-dependent oxidoreductase [Natronobiforma cellulositropha]